jgi:hypothetical protein
MIRQNKKLVRGREALGKRRSIAPCATVKQRARTPKGPMSARDKNEKQKIPLFPRKLKK